MSYQHTQAGTVIVVSLGIATIAIAGMAVLMGWHPVAIVVLCILLACVALFHSLTVEIRGDTLECRFGVGLIRKRFPLAAIRNVESVRNPWYYGWGIHWVLGLWVFNVSGFRAVQITLASGRRYRVGTDEPEELAQAIRQRISEASPSASGPRTPS